MSEINELLKKETDIETSEDSVGGGGGYVKESGVYKVGINHAFFEKSKGGALGLNISMRHSDENKTEFNNTIYVTSGDAKQNKNYYLTKQGKKRYLPGYTLADNIVQIISGSKLDLEGAPTSAKSVEVYDGAAGGKVNKEVQVIDCLTKQVIQVGIVKELANKWKDGAPTSDSMERNVISSVFDKSGKTLQEIEAGKEASFIDKWKSKYEGVTDDVRTVKGDTSSSQYSAPTASQETVETADDTDDVFDD